MPRDPVTDMLEVRRIESLDLPELAPYCTLRRHTDHQRERIFVAEGAKVVQRLLESRFEFVSALLTENWLRELMPLLEARPEKLIAYVAPIKVLEALTGFPLFQGALAVGRIPEAPSLDSILERCARPSLLVAVEGLTSAENMGVVVRNCAAFGVHGLITDEKCASPFLRRAVRNSMGTIFKLPVVEVASLVETLRQLRSRGIACLAAHPRADYSPLPRSNLSGDCCLVFGSEGHGLSPAVLDACDHAAAIPMANEVDSLNIGNACAVFLYEAYRQRRII